MSSPAMSRRVRLWSGLAVSVLLALTASFGLTSSAASAATGVSLSATVNGQPAATSSDARPAQLYPSRQATITVKVTNEENRTITVSTVRFQGDVLSLPLFSYDTAVSLSVPPGRTKSLTFPVVLSGIGSQATGLVGASITILGPNGSALASQSLVTNVLGSVRSIYGLFGLVVLVLTLSSLAIALLSLARHTLSPNRWARGVRFFVPGFGIGLVLTFTLSVFRIFVPTAGRWLPLLIVPSIVGLAIGFLTPAPNEEEYDDYDDDVLLAQIVVVDDDPLEANGSTPQPSPLVTTAGAAGGARATAGTPLPDSRPTGESPPSEGRGTAPPAAPPDSRPTAEGLVTPTDPQPDGRPTADS